MDFELIIINYHYIREENLERGIVGISPKFFSDQLDLIHLAGFKFISLEMLNSAIINKTTHLLPLKSCMITFDDGLKESFDIGLSILDKKGIPGVFYVPTAIISKNLVLDVHKFHYIMSCMTNSQILGFFSEEYLSKLELISMDIIKNQYSWDNFETARLKYLINFLIPQRKKNDVISKMFNHCVDSENLFAENLYMSKDQLRFLADRQYLGSHCINHLPLSSLTPSELSFEIQGSRRVLKNVTGYDIYTISYPYGGITAISKEVFDSAIHSGYVSGVTMIRGVNTQVDLICNPLQLKRFDTNDVFGGKSSNRFVGF